MFKKAKYRWQIKSSSRSNQLAGLEADIEVEQFTGVDSVVALDPEIHIEPNTEDHTELESAESVHMLFPERNELSYGELARKRGGDHLDSDDPDEPKAKLVCRRQPGTEDKGSADPDEAGSLNSLQFENCGGMRDEHNENITSLHEMKNVMETDKILSEQYIIKASAKHWCERKDNPPGSQELIKMNDNVPSKETSIIYTDIADDEKSSEDADGVCEFSSDSVMEEIHSKQTVITYSDEQCIRSNEAHFEISSSDLTGEKLETFECLASPAIPIDSEDDMLMTEEVSDIQSDRCPFTAIKSKTLALSEELSNGADNEAMRRDISPAGTPDTSPCSQERLERLSEIMDPEGMPPPAYPPPSTTPRRLTYLERWRCQHLAKAMVDNAINKTLEESGLSPNPDPDLIGDATRRSNVESEGVSHAIRMVGLRPRYSPSSMQRLNPIINRLTQVSENIFSANLRLRERNRGSEQGQLNVRPSSPSPPPVSQLRREETGQPTMTYTRRTEQVMYHFGRDRSESVKAEVRQASPCEHGELGHGTFTSCKQCINNYPRPYPPHLPPVHLNSTDPLVEHMIEPNVVPVPLDSTQTPDETHETHTTSDKAESVDSASIDDIDLPGEPMEETGFGQTEAGEKNPAIPTIAVSDTDLQENLNTSFILDTAVAFAINEKGLQLG